MLDRDSGDIHVHAILLDEEAFRAHPGVRYPDPEELEVGPRSAVPRSPRASPPSRSSPSRSSTGTQFDARRVAVSDVMEGDFGRIAAQTAKQVILQRIREAEREMMFDEYQDRVGDVVTGIVQQSDSATRSSTSAGSRRCCPGSEQVPGERYEHGARIKAVIIEVRSGTKGPQIVLSRRSEELIRELFELEVPEIDDGLVVIRAVAREAGYRSKIAVESRAQGVDPVGACVGPRGIARAHGRGRAARREDRHHPVERRARPLRREGARAGARARGRSSTTRTSRRR